LNYCSECGSKASQRIPDGDNRERSVCDQCGTIHYQNPKNVTGCILYWGNKVLLCKRAIEPRYGYWTLPAGFMENHETTREGAAREAYEEANATALNGYMARGEESLEVGLFEEKDVPWDELAFPVVTESLQRFFEDRTSTKVHVADIKGRPGTDIEIIRYST